MGGLMGAALAAAVVVAAAVAMVVQAEVSRRRARAVQMAGPAPRTAAEVAADARLEVAARPGSAWPLTWWIADRDGIGPAVWTRSTGGVAIRVVTRAECPPEQWASLAAVLVDRGSCWDCSTQPCSGHAGRRADAGRAVDGNAPRRCATGCGLRAAEGDRYCGGCGSATDRNAWADR